MRLENWFFSTQDSPYTPPEYATRSICGEVYGSRTFNDGDRVTTSVVIELDELNKTITTKSGSKYELGKPDSKWVDWVKKNYPDKLKNISFCL